MPNALRADDPNLMFATAFKEALRQRDCRWTTCATTSRHTGSASASPPSATGRVAAASRSASSSCRAVHDDARRLTIVHTLDSWQTGAVDLTVPHGLPPDSRFRPELNCVIADFPFARPLARNETAVVEYTLRSASTAGISHQHERRITTPLQTYLLQVRLHPLAVPSKCWHSYRRQLGIKPLSRQFAHLDGFRTTHLLPTKCPPGAYGIEWQWTDS